MALTDEQKAKAEANLVAPRSVTVDTETVTNHSLPDQIAFHNKLASDEVTKTAVGAKFIRINPPSALGRNS